MVNVPVVTVLAIDEPEIILSCHSPVLPPAWARENDLRSKSQVSKPFAATNSIEHSAEQYE